MPDIDECLYSHGATSVLPLQCIGRALTVVANARNFLVEAHHCI
eukprot:SAG11_NODE_15603_length_572_cov_1.033827_1_plen_43_part_10